MIIEKMQSEHTESVYEIACKCFNDPWSKDALKGELENPLASMFVALLGCDVIGFGGVQIITDEAYITNIAVKKGARKKGTGSLILSAIINFCRQNGCRFVTLEVRTSNSAAISMYEKSGFASQGIRKGFYSNPTEDANIMTLFLKD